MSVVLSAVSLAAVLSVAAPVPDEDAGPVEDPVLAALVAEALERSPELGAAEHGAAAAREQVPQARSLPDPMLSLTYQNDGWSPSLGTEIMTNLGVMWSQDLPFPGKRRLRGELASLGADQAREQVSRARLSLVAAVRRAYYGLLQARALLELVREQEEIWRQIEGVARARYAVGQGAQQDVLRVQVEVTRIGQLEAEQSAEAAIRLAELNRLLGRAAGGPVETPARLRLVSLEEPLPRILERLREASPELASARLGVEQGRVAVALASKEFKPDFAVRAGYMNRGGLDPMWQAGIGVSLPVHRGRLRAGRAEAEARLLEMERRVESVDLQLRFRTEERCAQLRATERIVELYAKGIIPQDRMSVEAAVASYQAGQVPFITVLEALGTLYADRSTHVRLLAGHARTRASVEEASLEPTSDLPSMGAPSMAGTIRMGAAPSASPGGAGMAGERPGSSGMR